MKPILLSITTKTGYTFQTKNLDTELYGYFCKWLDGNWPSKYFSLTRRDGTQIVLTDPSNISHLEVIEPKE